MFNSGLSHLIKKEFLIEFRQKSTLAGILVYIISTVFVSALCFKKIINPTVWNALFWVIFLFITINVSSKSFLQETKGKALFNYMYYHPRHFILSKIMYNMLLMAVLSFPIIIPLLLLLLKMSKSALDGISITETWDEIAILSSLDEILYSEVSLAVPDSVIVSVTSFPETTGIE